MSVGLSLGVWLVSLMSSLLSLVAMDEGKREEPAIVGGPLKLQEEKRVSILFSRWVLWYKIIVFLPFSRQGSHYQN